MYTYRQRDSIDKLINSITSVTSPVYDFVSLNGVGNRLWVVKEEEKINLLIKEFRKVPCLYIADGQLVIISFMLLFVVVVAVAVVVVVVGCCFVGVVVVVVVGCWWWC